jgi:heterodisulfide reductase subunit A-like polyferredoxin
MKGLKQNIFRKKLDQELRLKEGVVIVDELSCDGCGDCVKLAPIQQFMLKRFQKKKLINCHLKAG